MFELPLLGACITGAVGLTYKLLVPTKKRPSYTQTINELFVLKNVKNALDQYPTVYDVTYEDTHVIVRVNIPLGLTSNDLDKITKPMKDYFKNDCILIEKDYRYHYKLYTTYLKKYYAYNPVTVKKDKGFNICLGESRDGILTYNFTTNDPAMSVTSTTGGGKSNFINYLLCNVIENYSADELELSLIDLKGTELIDYKDIQHTVYHTDSVNRAVSYFNDLLDEIDTRYKIIGKDRDIVNYNKHHKDQLKYRLVVVEEVMSLLDKANKFENTLAIILSKCRAAGIYCIFTSQRLASDIIPTKISCNIGCRVGFRAASAQESKNAIGYTGLELIGVKGRGKAVISSEPIDFQSYHITNEKVAEITDKHRAILKPVEPVVVDIDKTILETANGHLEHVKQIEKDSHKGI